jgi:hypothetical protein
MITDKTRDALREAQGALTAQAYDDTYQPGPPDPADRSLAWYYLAWAIFGGLAATGALWWMGVL